MKKIVLSLLSLCLPSLGFAAPLLTTHGDWTALYGTVDCDWAAGFLEDQNLSPVEIAPGSGRCTAGFAFEKMLDTKFSVAPGQSHDFDVFYWSIQVEDPSNPPFGSFYFFEFRGDKPVPVFRWKQSIGYTGTDDYRFAWLKFDIELDTYDIAGTMSALGRKELRAKRFPCFTNCDLANVVMGASPTGTFAPLTAYATPAVVTPVSPGGQQNVVSSMSDGLGYSRLWDPALGDSVTFDPDSAAAEVYGDGDFQAGFWFYVPNLGVRYTTASPL